MTANGVPLASAPTADSRQTPLPGARAALLLLLAINLFNYIDRYVLAAVLPKLKAAFVADDPNAQTKLGALTTAFLVSYMVLAPLFGWLGDRVSRWLLVSVGVVLWSLASGASGLAAGFTMLLLTRCFVGVGEAAYGPVAPSMISDLYPVKIRGSVLAWFFAAIPVGSALGYVLGGLVADSSLGWRWAFYLVVPPGLLLGLWAFLMREPPRGQADAGPNGVPRKAGLKDYLVLTKIPSYVLDTVGMTALTFAIGGIAAWMPTYIYEREGTFALSEEVFQTLREGREPVPESVLQKLEPLTGRAFHPIKEFQSQLKAALPADELAKYKERILDVTCTPSLGLINTIFGAIVVVSGLAATLLGGLAGDRLRARLPGSYFLVSGVSMLIAFPMILLVLWTPFQPFPWAWIFVFLAVFFLFFNTGPTNTILANVTHPSIRSTAYALNILIIHLFGDAISPVVIGGIADRATMDVAFGVVSAVILAGAVVWLWGARYLERDTALAVTRLDRLPVGEPS